MKKTKKGERQLDLKPLIYQLQVLREDERPAVAMRVSTGSTDNIKPELVLETYCREIGMEITPLTFEVQREEIYAPDFVPLEALGEDIE